MNSNAHGTPKRLVSSQVVNSVERRTFPSTSPPILSSRRWNPCFPSGDEEVQLGEQTPGTRTGQADRSQRGLVQGPFCSCENRAVGTCSPVTWAHRLLWRPSHEHLQPRPSPQVAHTWLQGLCGLFRVGFALSSTCLCFSSALLRGRTAGGNTSSAR